MSLPLRLSCVIALLTCGAYSAEAKNSRAFCVDYANEAVEMQRRNLELGCEIKGLRWHEWWDGHYGWCVDWVGPDQVEEHTDLRRTEIEACEDRAGDRRYSRRRD